MLSLSHPIEYDEGGRYTRRVGSSTYAASTILRSPKPPKEAMLMCGSTGGGYELHFFEL